MDRASELGKKFGKCTDIPIVQDSDFRKTLARIVVAYAVLSGSFSEDHRGVVVLPEHVDWVSEWIDEIYSHPNCRLDQYSLKMNLALKTTVEEIEKYKDEIFEKRPRQERRGETVAEKSRIRLLKLHKLFQDQEVVTASEVQEVLNVKKLWVHRTFSMLKSKMLIEKEKYGYHRTAKFGKYLTNIFDDQRYRDVLQKVSTEYLHEDDQDEYEQENPSSKF
jgi:predicted transcriptional regulator